MAEMHRSTAVMNRPAEAGPQASPAPQSRAARIPGAVVVDRALELNQRFAPTALRLALAVVFVWFGALKIVGVSPVHDLLAQTLPFLAPNVVVPGLGIIEVVLGLAVAVGAFPRVVLIVLVGHLVGTFLTFVTATHLMFQAGNPLELTGNGEFVVKNLILISAALLLIASHTRRAAERAAA